MGPGLFCSRPHSSLAGTIDPKPPNVLIFAAAVFVCGCAGDNAQMIAQNSAQVVATPASPAPDSSKAATPTALNLRKIIYDARIDLLVKSMDSTERAVLDLIKVHGGFLAESNIAAQSGTQRDATWRIRVPVDRFDSFVSAVSKLGEVRTNHVGSQDVTEEFADLEARIRNKQEEEKRLLKHLADSTGRLEDILTVEREITRVRGEIEQMQGRLRFLANRADLSTITITATEWKDYTPPAPMTFQAQISHTFSQSLDALVAFGKAILLVVVALIPWTPVIVIGLFVLLRMIRSGRRSAAT